MAKAISARRDGDDYQARLFWCYASKLRTSDQVERVVFESDGVSFVDDLIVTYREPQIERATGRHFRCDYFQCKCHVTQAGAFTWQNLINPEFIRAKASMLGRLFNASKEIEALHADFRLYIFSNWIWHPDDPLAAHLSEEAFRPSLFEAGPGTTVGKVRRELAAHISLEDGEFRPFFERVRFRLGRNLTDLEEQLVASLRLAQMRPPSPQVTSFAYDDLAWKLFKQGRNDFDNARFEAMIQDEDLTEPLGSNHSEITLRSRSQHARRPRGTQTMLLDVCDLFDDRIPVAADCWRGELPRRLTDFLARPELDDLPAPIHLFFDCHLSIAFAAGYLLRKSGLPIIPAHKNPRTGYDLWTPEAAGDGGQWQFNVEGAIREEAVLAISVSNPVQNHLDKLLASKYLQVLPRIEFTPSGGVGLNSVRNSEHAWQLGHELRTRLQELLLPDCRRLHLFFSAPAALAYIFGHLLRGIVSELCLYEHDFEGNLHSARYSPACILPFQR